MSRVWGGVRGLTPRTVLLLGYALFFIWAFPGYMSNDSTLQLEEARRGVFSDGNPPLMAVEWMCLDKIVAGPILMLILQSLLFFGGLFVLLGRFMSQRAAAWTAAAILLFPPVMTPMAVIWKDSQMAAYLLAGTAALTSPRLRIRLLGLGLLVAACLMRHNALAAAAPLVGIIFEWRNPIAWWKRLGMIVAAAILALGALLAVNRVIAKNHVKMTPAFHDIVGVIAFSDDRTDDELRESLRGVPLAFDHDIQQRCRKVFAMRGVWRVMWGEDRIFEYPQTDEQWAAINRAWKQLVLDNPHAYLASHWDVFRTVLGVSERPRAPVYNLYVEVDSVAPLIHHNAAPSRAQAYYGKLLYWLADDTPMFRPWIYMVIALLLIALASRDRITLGLFASGILYELSFVPAFAEPDSRYSHWMITATTIAAVLLFVQRRRKASS